MSKTVRAIAQQMTRSTLRYTVGRFLKIRIYRTMFLPVRQRAIKHYVDTHPVRKLQIGTGPNILHGWLNTDVYPETGFLDGFRRIVFLDATKPLPFENCSIDYIFSEHVIEHLSYNQVVRMLRECYRILRPRGKIRLATPDLRAIAGLVSLESSDPQIRYSKFIMENFLSEIDADIAAETSVVARGSFSINVVFYGHGHKFIFDQQTLQSTMEEVGYTDITRKTPGESDDPVLRGLEMHGRAIGNEEANRFETMALEGLRPA